MNCNQARQAILIDPQRLLADVSGHIQGCGDCQRYQSNSQQWDVRAVQAMRQPIKENLTQRVMAAQRLQAARRRVVYSIAASIAAITIALALIVPRSADGDVGRLMAEHLEEDPLDQAQSDPNANAQLAGIMAQVGAVSRTSSDGSRYGGLPKLIQVKLCPVGSTEMVHAVFEVNGKRVVAFLSPRRGKAGAADYKEWQGELVAVNGGLVGVFSLDGAAMQSVKTALMNNITWQVA